MMLSQLERRGLLFGTPANLSEYVRAEDVVRTPKELERLLAESAEALTDGQFQAEGWGVFNIPPEAEVTYPVEWLQCGLERVDESGVFATDPEVDAHVVRRALEGSRPHWDAVNVHLLANALRCVCWGPEYVASRCGPDYSELTPEQLTAVQELAASQQRGPLTAVGMPGW